MGGFGSGVKGSGEGVYFQVVMDADEAIMGMSKLDGKVDDVAVSFEQLAGKTKVAHSEFSTMGPAIKDTTDDMKELELQQMLVMAKLTMVVSGLNQLTGSLYKTIGGLEAVNAINEEQARSLQEGARAIELFTGPLEFLISLEILASAAGKPFLATLWAKVPAFGAVGTSAAAAATAIWAFLAPILLVVAAAAIVVAVIVLIVQNLDVLRKGVDHMVNGAKAMLSVFTSIGGVVVGLTSSMGALGDMFTDNPISKMLSKGGGVNF